MHPDEVINAGLDVLTFYAEAVFLGDEVSMENALRNYGKFEEHYQSMVGKSFPRNMRITYEGLVNLHNQFLNENVFLENKIRSLSEDLACGNFEERGDGEFLQYIADVHLKGNC